MIERWPRRFGKIVAAIAAGTAVACAIAFAISFAFVAATWGDGSGKWDTSLLVGVVAGYFTLLAFPALFLLTGLPLYAFSLRTGWVNGRVYATVGAIVSCLVAIAAWVAIDASPTLDLMVPCIVCGGTGATLAFWIVARPDQSSPHLEE